MAPVKGDLLARSDFPMYLVSSLGERHFLVAGGGGQAKTGVANAIVSLQLLLFLLEAHILYGEAFFYKYWLSQKYKNISLLQQPLNTIQKLFILSEIQNSITLATNSY